MPNSLGFKANLGEWRTVIMSLHHTKNHLSDAASTIEDEEEQLIAYDHLERLDRLIPRMERELSEELETPAEQVDDARFAPTDPILIQAIERELPPLEGTHPHA